MSSHHIVRDCQEPALWITTLNSCDFEVIHELLGWSPWLMVDAEIVDQVINWGLKIDALLVSTVEKKNYLELTVEQNPLQVIDYQDDKIGFGLDYAIHKGIDTIHMCTSPGEAQKIQITYPKFEWVFFYQNYKMTFQKNHYWKKWVTTEQVFILHGEQLETSNLIKNPKGINTYQAQHEGFVEIKSKKEGFWISEKID